MHDYENEESMNCVPPKDVLIFGKYIIEKNYRKALFNKYPFYTVEEIIVTYLGHNSNFNSQETFIKQQKISNIKNKNLISNIK